MYSQDFIELFKIPPFSLNKKEKEIIHKKVLNEITNYHYNNCLEYQSILDNLNYNPSVEHDIVHIPFLPVGLFKQFELLSVDKNTVINTVTSSGTTGSNLSKIYLDRNTALNQIKVLTCIFNDF